MSVRSSNPALREDTFTGFAPLATNTGSMSVAGTINKTGILLLISVITASFTWSQALVPGGQGAAMALAMAGSLGGFILAMVTIFKPKASPYTAPVYAALEGLFLGGMSAVFNLRYPGIVPQAVGMTFATLAVMLLAYRSGLIQVTDKFRLGVVAATGGIAVFYLVMFVLQLFNVGGASALMHGGGILGIGISLFVVAVAALNLVLDFDFIEQGAARRAPAFMEWYGAFSLMVTLVWLYLEMLRLLSRLNSRN